MSGFVAPPPSTQPNPEEPDLDLVAGDDFYPPLSLSEFRDSMRVGTVVTDTRARDAIRGGMLTVRRELRKWKAGHVADGVATLAAVDDEEIDGQPAALLLYRRAVFAYAAADLAETHNDISSTGDGQKRLDDRTLSADEHRRNGIHAIRDMLGADRSSVELI